MRTLLTKTPKRIAALLAILAMAALPMTVSADSTKTVDGNVIYKADPLAVAERFTYSHYKTDPGTVAKAAAGTVHTVTVNTKGASNAHVAIWDAASYVVSGAGLTGTLIADIDTNAATGSFILDADFASGLVISCMSGQAATACSGTNTVPSQPDVTVSYR